MIHIDLDINQILNQCQKKGYEYNEMKFWGRFFNLYEDEVIVEKRVHKVTFSGPKKKVKILEIKPKTKLTLQRHYLKMETWISLSDNVHYDVGASLDTLVCKKMNSMDVAFIEKRQIHRLMNLNDYPVLIYEIQEGLCSENDVERFDTNN